MTIHEKSINFDVREEAQENSCDFSLLMLNNSAETYVESTSLRIEVTGKFVAATILVNQDLYFQRDSPLHGVLPLDVAIIFIVFRREIISRLFITHVSSVESDAHR